MLSEMQPGRPTRSPPWRLTRLHWLPARLADSQGSRSHLQLGQRYTIAVHLGQRDSSTVKAQDYKGIKANKQEGALWYVPCCDSPGPGDQVLDRKGTDQKPRPCGQPALGRALFYH